MSESGPVREAIFGVDLEEAKAIQGGCLSFQATQSANLT